MKILVVDDHVLIREALRGVFKELKGDAVMLEAPDCAQAMRLGRTKPDLELILLDLGCRTATASSCWPSCASATRRISVVVLSALTTATTSSRRSISARSASSRSPRSAR